MLLLFDETAYAQKQPQQLRAGALQNRARIYEPIIMSAAERYGVDPRLLWTIGYLETGFRPELASPKGARGLMQFMPATAVRYRLTRPHDPVASIHAAARYVRDLSRLFGNNVALILAAYNSGEGAVAAFRDGRRVVLNGGRVINAKRIVTGGIPPYRETRDYAFRGAAIFKGLKHLPIYRRNNESLVKADQAISRLSEPVRRASLYVMPDDDAMPKSQQDAQVISGGNSKMRGRQSIHFN